MNNVIGGVKLQQAEPWSDRFSELTERVRSYHHDVWLLPLSGKLSGTPSSKNTLRVLADFSTIITADDE